MENVNRELMPPPRLMPNGELRPVIEPPFKDMLPFPGDEMVEEWEPFPSEELEDQLTTDIVRKAQVTALADKRVMELLADKKYIPIGVSLLLEKRDDSEEISLLFVFYDYTDNFAIEVLLDREAQKIIGVEKMRYQPAPLQEEIEKAVALAREDSRLAKNLTDDMEGTAILVSSYDPDSKYYSHRQFDVRFGFPDERLPYYMALVDLSLEEVLKAGSVREDNLRYRGGKQ